MIATILGLPRWAQALGGLALAAAAFMLWLHFHDRAVVDRHEADVAAQVQATASAAASSAAAAVTETQDEVEKTNEQARDAAARSDDPLRAGLDRLRAAKAAPVPAPR